MPRSDCRDGKTQQILKSIEKCKQYLNSYDATLHRNIRVATSRRLEKLEKELNRITIIGEWNNNDEFTYNNLYADQPFEIERISAL